MTEKKYPFSFRKNEHNLSLAHDIAYNNDDFETVHEINEIMRHATAPVTFLPSKIWAKAQHYSQLAAIYRAEQGGK